MVDYLIVGQGIAGSCLALKLIKENKSFIIVDENKNKASTVAVGIYNPVVLKRFALIWKAEEQLELLEDYFQSFENLLKQKFLYKVPTYRIFNDESEKKTWKKKSALPHLKKFLSEEIYSNQTENLNAPLGYSEVLQTGRIDLENCLNGFTDYLIQHDLYKNERFDYSQLVIEKEKVTYKNILAKRVVFCEGFGIKNNPYFNYLPIIGVKGEVLKIETNKKIPNGIWKAYNFLMPLRDNICFTASTYNREDLSSEPSESGKQEILTHLKEIYDGNVKILEHTAGIRPTVIDRRPILGSHSLHKNLYILNGMGTRGTLLAPQMSEFLYDFIEFQKDIDKEADIRRFDKLIC